MNGYESKRESVGMSQLNQPIIWYIHSTLMHNLQSCFGWKQFFRKRENGSRWTTDWTHGIVSDFGKLALKIESKTANWKWSQRQFFFSSNLHSLAVSGSVNGMLKNLSYFFWKIITFKINGVRDKFFRHTYYDNKMMKWWLFLFF